MQYNFPENEGGGSSVPNSSDGLIFVKRRAKEGLFFFKNTGVRRAQRRAKIKFLWFCDLVHIQSVVDLFAKQLYNGVERSERAQNHK